MAWATEMRSEERKVDYSIMQVCRNDEYR